MERRSFIKQTAGWGLALFPLTKQFSSAPFPSQLNGPRKPVFVYNNWSAYDELSDKVVQTEALAMRELNELIRLKRKGVQIDYYVMDAFWFDKWGGYRTWHKEHWPNGPDKWLNACKENHVLPGMWFSSNLIATHEGRFLEPVPEWQDSVATDPNILCLFDGGYLHHLSQTLQQWYDRGVRLFKFDFAYFEAVTPAAKDKFTKEEIKEKNKTAFMKMLQAFRARNNDVLITGYNGFGGDMENTFTPFSKVEKIDPRWLNAFDTLYSGDSRFSDVPMMNIWRSQDNYSDHMVRQFEYNGLPLRRIDNCAFMIGTTGTCYYRGHHAWKGMLLLELARGGWMNVYHGNLELLTEEDAAWFAKVQALYHPFQSLNAITTFGPIPGTGKPYGFKASAPEGDLFTVVNPGQDIGTVSLPRTAGQARVLYADGRFIPSVKADQLTLGAEQLVVVGTGDYADPRHNLGTDKEVRIPLTTEKLDIPFTTTGHNTIEGKTRPIPGKTIRILLQQFGADGFPYRSWGGAPPDGKKMDTLITIVVRQNDKILPLRIEYDKMIWSGLSWAAAELPANTCEAGIPLEITCRTAEKEPLRLEARVYAVSY